MHHALVVAVMMLVIKGVWRAHRTDTTNRTDPTAAPPPTLEPADPWQQGDSSYRPSRAYWKFVEDGGLPDAEIEKMLAQLENGPHAHRLPAVREWLAKGRWSKARTVDYLWGLAGVFGDTGR